MIPRLRVHSFALLVLLAGAFYASAQVPASSPADQARILAYIASSWGTLSRSMSECKSLVDTKVTTAPVLYLPAGMLVPPAVKAAEAECHIEVKILPHLITHMGEVRTSEIATPGLLYLPNRYVVPGGRFNEMYGWDSYFILLGLVRDGKIDLARGMVENFFFEIENYGAVLNANRTYFFTRSQPPFLSSMILEVYERASTETTQTQDKAWLDRAYAYAVRDHALWTSAPHLAGSTGLARYVDLGAGPVPEMADDSGYYPDVIRWFIAHPDQSSGYLLDAPDDPTPAQSANLAKTSCDVAQSKVCARAHVNGHRLTAAFYKGDRSMRESGFDTSFRFGPFSGATDRYAPVCLNSLLFKYERDLAHIATLLGRSEEAKHWVAVAAIRKVAMDKYLWNASEGMYYDYDFTTQKPSSYRYLTTFYPLWAGAASPAQAAAVASHLALFEHNGGLAMSDHESGTQWDLPFGWAPTNWLTVEGLAAYGFLPEARRVAGKFSATVMQNFLADGTIREKYNVVSGSANIAVAAGYKSNVVGFGWTNGVYRSMQQLLEQPVLPQPATPTK